MGGEYVKIELGPDTGLNPFAWAACGQKSNATMEQKQPAISVVKAPMQQWSKNNQLFLLSKNL